MQIETNHTGLSSEVLLDPTTLTLRFGEDVRSLERPDVRTAADLQAFLQHPEAAHAEDIVYVVYRDVTPEGLASEIARRGLRYVVTVVRPGCLGAEWSRTRGHVNSHAPGTNLAYPEVHEIWQGRATLYLQSDATEAPQDAAQAELVAGDKVVIAPGWASLLTNTGTEPLVLGSWRMADCVPHSEALAEHGGMAYHLLCGDENRVTAAPNPRYARVPALRTVTSVDHPDFGLRHGEPLLTAFHRNPDYLRFLLRPQDFTGVWKNLYAPAEP